VNKLEDYIVIFDDVVPHNLCDAIIKEYEPAPEWMDAQVNKGVVQTSIRNVNIISISTQETINKNLFIRKQIDDELFDCARKAIIEYNKKFPFSMIEQDSGYDLLRYKKGQFYKQHVDSYKQNPRSVSCSFSLNSNYEGGEWSFFDRKMTVKMKKGSAIMFPSTFLYPHEILEVKNGTRYAIVTWFI